MPEMPGVEPEAVMEAVSALASQLGVPVQQVQVIDFQTVDWPDSCLGAGGADEGCLTVITPGYRVTLEVNGARHEVRTDQTGSNIRIVN
jgi:hypothetical protein